MTYRINKTDGNLISEIPDGTFDTASTSLTLIGKNVTNFGESLNENLIKLLENFASGSAPEQAIKGQLWYDTSTGRLNVYDGNQFRTSGGPLISSQVPTDWVPGDLWINNETNQLWFYDGADQILAGPIYTYQQGLSGFKVESILDNLSRSRVIVKLFVSDQLIGIFSKVAFTPLFPIEGFTGSIGIGFTTSNLSGNKFEATVSKAEKLITSLGEEKLADDIIYNNEDGVIAGSLTVQSQDGLRLLGGVTDTNVNALGDVSLRLVEGSFIIENAESSRSIEIRTKKPIEGTKTAMYIDAVNQRIGFFNTAPEAEVDITGNLKVSGNLLVQGETLSINVTNVALKDKNIELNRPESGTPTSAMADAGGIVLLGGTSKTILYNYDSGNVANSTWTSSEHWNLVNGKEYRIGDAPVLNYTTLGAGVINSSLTSLGNLTTLTMQDGVTTGINITANTITGATDLVLTSATGNIDVDNKRIINVPNLDFATSLDSDAANKKYVDDQVYLRPVVLTVDTSGFDLTSEMGDQSATEYVLTVLNNIAPVYDTVSYVEGLAIEGTIAKILATSTTIVNDDIVYSPVRTGFKTQPYETEAYEQVAVDKAGGSENQPVVRDLAVNQVIPAPAATASIVSVFKRFKVKRQLDTTLAWEFVTNFVFRGTWLLVETYAVKETVVFQNQEYICVSATNAGESPEGEPQKWALLASL